jgi:hypothetical protein
MNMRSQILITLAATTVLFASGNASAATLGTDDFDTYTAGTDILGAIGHNSNPTWIKRGDTSGFEVLNPSGTDGQVGRASLPGAGSATAYYGAHTHTDESILITSIEMTIPSATSPPGSGASFWGSFYLGLHQTPSTSGPPFPPLAGSYLLAVRGNQDFNLFKYNDSNVVETGQPAPVGDPGGGGWTNFNDYPNTPSNHNDAAGNLALDTTYILQLERDSSNQTITGTITEKINGLVVGQGSFVDPGITTPFHTGGNVSLVLTGAPPGGFPDSYLLDNFELADAPDGTFDWDTSGLGNWSSPSSWNPLGGPPNNEAHIARFGDLVSVPTTVVTNDQVTVNRIEFNNSANGYAIGGLGGVTLTQNTATEEDPRIDVVAGDHQFQAPLTINNDTTVGVAAASSLIFNNALNLGGNTLFKTGLGNMAINNALNSGGGAVQCLEGTCSGTGTVGGDLINNGGTVSPGNSPGVMEVPGDFTQYDGSTLLIELAGTAAGSQYDVLQVDGEASLGGTLEVTLLDGFEPAAGDSFEILEFAFVAGGFDELILPGLVGALSWDASALLTDGNLSVVPEPATWSLLLLGLLLGFRRRCSRAGS